MYKKKVFQPRTCAVCGISFTPTSATHKYCSRACCKQKWNRTARPEHKGKTDFTVGEVWELDMSLPMDLWKFERVKFD